MRYTIGIDEVGRGSLAGPVAVSAVCIPRGFRLGKVTRILGKLRDSKKLSEIQRERWLSYFRSRKEISFAVARVYPRVIDSINIARAANRAAWRAVRLVVSKCKVDVHACNIVLDGGLYLESGAEDRAGISSRTIVRGDEKIIAIKIASIIAKVSRDRGMRRLSKRFPNYAFDLHKGYGTKRHIKAIKQFGLSPIHRRIR